MMNFLFKWCLFFLGGGLQRLPGCRLPRHNVQVVAKRRPVDLYDAVDTGVGLWLAFGSENLIIVGFFWLCIGSGVGGGLLLVGCGWPMHLYCHLVLGGTASQPIVCRKGVVTSNYPQYFVPQCERSCTNPDYFLIFNRYKKDSLRSSTRRVWICLPNLLFCQSLKYNLAILTRLLFQGVFWTMIVG